VRIILKRIVKKYGGGVDWIDLAQYMYKWRALVLMGMNLRIL
jgi:hypothetical protein